MFHEVFTAEITARGSLIHYWNFPMSDYSKFKNLPRKLRKPAREQFAKSIDAVDFIDLKLAAAVSQHSFSTDTEIFLSSVRGKPKIGTGFPLSARVVREATAEAAIEVLLRAARNHPDLGHGKSRLRLLTIKADVGLVDIANPYFPAELVKRHARRLLGRHDVEALCFLDHCLFSPSRGHEETLAHIHTHIAVSFRESKRSQKRLVAALAPASGNQNNLGDTIIDIRVRGTNEWPRLKDDDVAGLAQYLTKETCGVNTIFLTKKGQRSEGNHTDWTAAGVLRQLELWSYMDFRSASWSHGQVMGEVRTEWRRRTFQLLDYYQLPLGSLIDQAVLYRGWTRVWREFGNGFVPIDPDSITATSASSYAPPSWRPGVDSVLFRPGS